MTTSQILKSLAKGIDPDTGEELDSNSVVKTLEAIKIFVGVGKSAPICSNCPIT